MKRAAAPRSARLRAPTAAQEAAAASPARLAQAYESVALVLQGGGALGSYQCGVYEALHAAGIQPRWFAGTSIGAINAAILAGNEPARRVERLRGFWELICQPLGLAAPVAHAVRALLGWLPPAHALDAWANSLGALGALAFGQQGFFRPRAVSPFLYEDASAQATSFYDVTPLRHTLERFVDFERINRDRSVRLAVGATHVTSGNLRWFDSAREAIRPEHVMASGALPPAFAAVEIDGEHYWDGGLVSNTPLDHVLTDQPRRDSLVFQVDLWSARGELPRTMMDVFERQKDIQYSSRTRFGTDHIAHLHKLHHALRDLVAALPPGRIDARLRRALQPLVSDRVFNIVHLIYQSKPFETQFKDYAFGLGTMRGHWAAGLLDMQHTLAHPEFLAMPARAVGIATHDVHRLGATRASAS